MKQVALKIAERVNLLGILPQQGNFVTMKHVEDFRNELIFTAEEVKEYEIRFSEDGKQVLWKMTAETYEKSFEVNDIVVEALKKALAVLDKDEKITSVLMPLYDKFCN